MTGASRPLRYVDGWYTDDPGAFRFYTRDARRWSYRAQLAVDLRSWKPWAWWSVAAVSAILGLRRGSPSLVTTGLAWALAYAHMLRKIVQGHRRSVLLDGVAVFDRRHPLRTALLAGELRHENPAIRERVVALLPEWAGRTAPGRDAVLRVLVAHSPTAEYSPVIGIKPDDVSRDESGARAGEG